MASAISRESDAVREDVQDVIQDIMIVESRGETSARMRFVRICMDACWKQVPVVPWFRTSERRGRIEAGMQTLERLLDGKKGRDGETSKVNNRTSLNRWILGIQDWREKHQQQLAFKEVQDARPEIKVANDSAPELHSAILFRSIVNQDWVAVRDVANELLAEGK